MMERQAYLPGAPKIFSAIAGVISDIGVVSKDKVNKQQGFKYRSIDDVYSALNPALAKNKVFILPEILEENRETKTTRNGAQMICVILKMKYTIYAEDGSHIETVLKGEAMDTGDKAINKAMAIAYKYLCFQLFCIPVEDMADPDAERPELDGGNQEQKGKKTASGRKAPGTKAASKEVRVPPDPAAAAPVAPAKQEGSEPAAADDGRKITEAMVSTIRAEQKRTGVPDKAVLSRLHTKARRIEDITVEEFKLAMKIFQATKDLKREEEDEYQ